ncbi:hypothetical protein MTO96_029520 [Rhipicephalus appendiculatus]
MRTNPSTIPQWSYPRTTRTCTPTRSAFSARFYATTRQEESWERCEEAWTQAVALAAEAVRLPPASSRRTTRPIDPDNAADIQRLYRRNRWRAIRLILEGPTRSCDIPLAELQDHRGTTWTERTADTTILFQCPAAPEPRRHDAFFGRRSPCTTMKGPEHSPGLRQTYLPPLEVCRPRGSLPFGAVQCVCTPSPHPGCLAYVTHGPHIQEGGNPSVPSKWRPIALGSTASKLYAKCLAARLQAWVMEDHVLSHCQKGFLRTTACLN